ncbi:hypothetical protein PENTCL1PPCAC_30402, partial [Pristionchus entomophagus]
DQRPCLICSAPSQYAHFGVDSCRSCADFFKRTVTADRKFICRQGDGKCTINPKDRHNCRGCRMARCKQLGMRLSDEKATVSELLQLAKSVHPPEDTLISRLRCEYLASVERRKICEFTIQPTALRRHIRAKVPGENLMLCTWTFILEALKIFAGDFMRFAAACFPEFAALTTDDQV